MTASFYSKGSAKERREKEAYQINFRQMEYTSDKKSRVLAISADAGEEAAALALNIKRSNNDKDKSQASKNTSGSPQKLKKGKPLNKQVKMKTIGKLGRVIKEFSNDYDPKQMNLKSLPDYPYSIEKFSTDKHAKERAQKAVVNRQNSYKQY